MAQSEAKRAQQQARTKQRLKELQVKLEDYQTKLAQNRKLRKQVTQEQARFGRLETQIIAAKKQKVQLAQKIAGQASAHRNWRQQQVYIYRDICMCASLIWNKPP